MLMTLDSLYVPLLLIVYGTHVTTTMVPVLATVLATPETATGIVDKGSPFSSLNPSQFSSKSTSDVRHPVLMICIKYSAHVVVYSFLNYAINHGRGWG